MRRINVHLAAQAAEVIDFSKAQNVGKLGRSVRHETENSASDPLPSALTENRGIGRYFDQPLINRSSVYHEQGRYSAACRRLCTTPP